MLNFFKNLNKKKNDDDINIIAKCPKCGKEVIETGDYWACVDILSGNCNFKMKNIHNGRKMDVSVFAEFQKIDEYEHIYNAIHRQSNITRARIYETENKNPDGPVRLRQGCPNCGGLFHRHGNIVKCSKPKCRFKIETTFMGINFSDEQMSQLLERRISEIYTFKNSKGEEITGRAIIKLDKKANLIPKYILVTEINVLDEIYFEYSLAPKEEGESMAKRLGSMVY